MYNKAAKFLKKRFDKFPEIAIILGTGLGALADSLEDAVIIDYRDIPSFPVSTVSGHKGELAVGRLFDVPVAVLCGRTHYYEGYSMRQLAIPVQTLCRMGVKKLIITNASGGISEKFYPGDVVMITDHIKLCAESPLTGKNPSELGDRFFDMSNAYDRDFQKSARAAAESCGIELKEGVYAYMAGPQFETPAEIRALKLLGADLVGMSTVTEVITAAHCGIKTLALSCVTNMAAGMPNGGLNREIISDAEKLGTERMTMLIKEILCSSK